MCDLIDLRRRRRQCLPLLILGVLLRVSIPLNAQSGSNDLQVVVDPERSIVDVADGLRFRVTIRNAGSAPLLLNGGALLGNGRQGWAAVTCNLRTADDAVVPLGLHWQMGGVAGRMYFLGVPLRPGDSHTFAVTPDDYYQSKPLPSARYDLSCTVKGTQSKFRDSTQLPPCWEGVATSAPVRIEIKPAK
jgi:hypothetical protein